MGKEKDLIEELFQSMDLIIDSKLNRLNYDITELCSIEEVKGNNEYYVSNGSAKYIAYAQGDNKYSEGTSVYVVIPQGDYNNQKLIVGKYTKTDSSSNKWVSPMEDFINITGNVFSGFGKYGLIANNDNEFIKEIGIIPNEYTQYDRLCISADFSNSLSDEMVIDGTYGLMLVGEKSDGKDFVCILNSSDMVGNPYDFSVPYNQQKMFVLSETDKISNLRLYFYQGLSDNNTFTKTFYDINNNLVDVAENNNLFVENISVNFGYSFDEYKNETALLYTLDNKTYKKNEVGVQGEKPQRTMRLRWVHKDVDDNHYSITDINHETLKDHYVKVHWYRYILQTDVFEDPLAGYFWREIEDNLNKFEYTTELETNWKEENFKVIIEFDDKIISSEVLEFTNPEGKIADQSMIQGLNILYPEDDVYRGKFYIYGDNQSANINTEKVLKLIADYKTVESQTDYWETTDVICWKFPANRTMIHKPEKSYEFFEGDTFIEAGSNKTATVNGMVFTSDPDYHLVIRQINLVNKDGVWDSEESRTQRYRINSQYINTYGNNTIKCVVYKPSVNAVEAEISFDFGLTGTNGTKYTLAVSWEELTVGKTTYQKPPAITLDGTDDSTETWKFNVEILDANHQVIKAPTGTGWNVDMNFVQPAYKTENDIKTWNTNVKGFININATNKTLSITQKTLDYVSNLFLILELKITNFGYNLTTYIPIAVRSSRNYAGLEGPTAVYYDSAGYNPKYNNKDYRLFKKDGTEEDSVFNIKYSITNANQSEKQLAGSQVPRLYIDDSRYTLQVPDTYLPMESGVYEGVCVYSSNKWVQPIYITMNPYGSQMFNEWDGGMVIDQDNGRILTSVIGAGKKNSDNTFSGVVLGEVGKATDTTKETGILGFQKGVQSFSLLNDGTATFGTSSSGQIKINGNTGVIKSAGYELNKSGTEINLTNATINTPRLWIDGKNSPYLKIADSKNAKKAYFEVGSSQVKMGDWTLDNNGKFIGANSNKYTLVSPPGATGSGDYVFAAGATSNSNWSTAPFRVTKEGKLYASSAEVEGDFKITSGSIKIGENFNVDNEGKLTASGVAVSGEITATSGKIENCSVGNLFVDGTEYSWNKINVISNISSVDLSTYQLRVVTDIGWSTYLAHYVDITKGEAIKKSFVNGLSVSAKKINLLTGVTINYSMASMAVLGGSVTSWPRRTGSATDPVDTDVTGGNFTCFTAGTKILMANNSMKNIEEINPGDMVMTYNEKTKVFEPGVVEKFKSRHISNEIFDLYLNDNTVISLTKGHPMLSTEGWKSLDRMVSFFEHDVETRNMCVGQQLIGINGLSTIEKIERRTNSNGFEVYNITVPTNNTYIANGYVAHNAAFKD